MKLLHTADWHVGRTIRGHSRADEHRAVLAEVAAAAAEHEVDVVLVAGDQFDTAAPSAEAEQIVYTALLDLARTGAQVPSTPSGPSGFHRSNISEPAIARSCPQPPSASSPYRVTRTEPRIRITVCSASV